MKTNQEYKNQALAVLKGNWSPAVLAAVVYTAIAIVVGMVPALFPVSEEVINIFSGVLSVLVALPLGVGVYNTYKAFLAGDNNCTSNLFRLGYGEGRYLHNVWGGLLMGIFIVLWTLLLIVPGLIKAYAYRLTYFILFDNPELSANEAIDLSKEMMKGHKFDLFCLELSFIGWGLLSLCTLGIGLFWLIPYMQTSVAAFYQDVKAEYELKNSIN